LFHNLPNPSDYQLLIVTIINLVFIVASAIIFGVYAKGRFSSTFNKVKTSTKALGWVLIGLLLALFITDVILEKNNMVNISSNLKINFGSTLIVVILLMLTQVADLISISPKQTQVELNSKE
jgi:multisubunit Na+/H+ antiporter MnhG subunit